MWSSYSIHLFLFSVSQQSPTGSDQRFSLFLFLCFRSMYMYTRGRAVQMMRLPPSHGFVLPISLPILRSVHPLLHPSVCLISKPIYTTPCFMLDATLLMYVHFLSPSLSLAYFLYSYSEDRLIAHRVMLLSAASCPEKSWDDVHETLATWNRFTPSVHLIREAGKFFRRQVHRQRVNTHTHTHTCTTGTPCHCLKSKLISTSSFRSEIEHWTWKGIIWERGKMNDRQKAKKIKCEKEGENGMAVG